MNRQPIGRPPKWWAPQLSPRLVRWSRGWRRRQLHGKQRIAGVETQGGEILTRTLAEGCGVLLTPNHSTHYDSAALYLSADALNVPLYFMAAWQVFAMSTPFEQWLMQRLGTFSIDRDSNDRQAYKQGVEILRESPYPLVIFPEGEIYHVSDRVTPFREGAAAIALAAAKKAERPVVVVPCGIKFWYLHDPSEELIEMLRRLEEQILLRPAPQLSLPERIHRVAEGLLALKELDFLGHTRSGRIRDRLIYLQDAVLTRLEQKLDLKTTPGTAPQRVKAIRQTVIRELDPGEAEEQAGPPSAERLELLHSALEDVFFVIQLFSYPGDYLLNGPTIERLAETVDKMEEDVFQQDYPSVRGRRQVVIRYGEPIRLPSGEQRSRTGIADLTLEMQHRVQQLIDGLNAETCPRASANGSA